MASPPRLKVGTRLGLAFAAILILLALIASVALVNLSQLNAMTRDLVVVDWEKNILTTDALDNARASMARVFQLALADGPDGASAALDDFTSNEKEFSDDLDQLSELAAGADTRALLDQAKASRDRYLSSVKQVAALAEAGQRDAALKHIVSDTYGALNAFAGTLRKLQSYQQTTFEEAGAQSDRRYRFSRAVMVALGAVALLFGAACAWLIARGITRQLGGEPDYAAAVVRRIAHGDLTLDVETRRGDDGSLLYGMRRMQDELKNTVLRIKEASESIGSASRQIAGGNADLSRRTEAQGSTLEEAAASLEQLTGTVKQNAENAQQANGLAAGASSVAAKGGAVVGEVVQTMSAINGASKKIADITGVIDGIAFQTNILALNAAVEAARAGEQGRGFAVVASEVRSLAQRSAAAAKEIKALITDSVQKVDAGTQLVDEAGRTMGEIMASVKRVTDIMSEIAAASQEQSSGIEQVNWAVTQMDETTQQNAALVEEAAAAAESLEEQARNLMQAVAVFKVASNEADGASKPERPAAVVTSLPVRDNAADGPRARHIQAA